MATKYKTAKPFKLDDYGGGGGGSILPNGTYRLEEVRAVMFDYNGKAETPACCLSVKFQPLNSKGKSEGDVAVQYYNTAVHAPGLETSEWIEAQRTIRPTKDGKKFELPEDYALAQKCETFLFMKALADAGFDMDQVEEDGDLSVIDGLAGEIVAVESTRKPSKNAKLDKDGKPFPVQVHVVKSIQSTAKPAGGKANGKAAEEKSSKKAADTPDAESILQEYMAETILLEDNEGGFDKLKARMGISTYVQNEKDGDAEMVKDVVAKFNDAGFLAACLSSAGWAVKKEKGKEWIYKSE